MLTLILAMAIAAPQSCNVTQDTQGFRHTSCSDSISYCRILFTDENRCYWDDGVVLLNMLKHEGQPEYTYTPMPKCWEIGQHGAKECPELLGWKMPKHVKWIKRKQIH